MGVTIKDVLALPELRECHLLCRDVSCCQSVRSITIMDNPDILDWMSDYEILLSNGSSLVDLNVLEWKAFFDGLVKKHSAALFIKLAYHVQSLPNEIVSYTRQLDFPVVVVPNSYSWVRISNPIQQFMIEKQFYFIHESMALRDALNTTMIQGGSIDDVCKAASRDLGYGVAVLTADGDLLGQSGCDGWDEVTYALRTQRPCLGQMRIRSGGEPLRLELAGSERKALLYKLPDRTGRYYAAFLMGETEGIVHELDAFKINYINTALLLCLCKEEELRRIELHYYIDFLTDLIDGALTEKPEIDQKAARLGRVVHKVYQVIVFESTPESPGDMLSGLVSRFKQEVDPSVRDIMYCVKDSRVILFCPVISEENREALEKACRITEERLGAVGMQFGASRPYAIERTSKAYEEASFAHSMRKLTDGRIVFYDDLGLLRLLGKGAREADVPFISDYYEGTIAPLAQHDLRNGTCLVETLQLYLKCDCSVSHSAEALYVHENTLRMRLKRIEAITGRSLRSAMGITELNLGLLIHEFIDG